MRTQSLLFSLVGVISASTGAPSAAAQYNWNADAYLCPMEDLAPCVQYHGEARGTRFLSWFEPEFGAIGAFGIAGPGMFERLIDTDFPTGDLEAFMGVTYPDVNSSGFGGYVPGMDYGYSDWGAEYDRIFLSFLLDSPVAYGTAAVGVDVGVMDLADYTGHPDCGEGGSFEGDPFTCPPYLVAWASERATITQVAPEPTSVVLLGTGLVGLAVVVSRRRKVD